MRLVVKPRSRGARFVSSVQRAKLWLVSNQLRTEGSQAIGRVVYMVHVPGAVVFTDTASALFRGCGKEGRTTTHRAGLL